MIPTSQRYASTPAIVRLAVGLALLQAVGTAQTTGTLYRFSPRTQGPAVSMGDLDGDGLAEYLVGDPGDYADLGEARIHSGKDGSVLGLVQGESERDGFGGSLAVLDDLDGDGIRDFAVAAPLLSPERTYVGVYSGRTMDLIYTLRAKDPKELLGTSITSLGDLDGDGLGDIAIGAPYPSGFPFDGVGSVRVHSGATGNLLWERTGNGLQATEEYGYSLARVSDMNGDGAEELLIGNPAQNLSQGYVHLRSGRGGALIRTFSAADVPTLGWSVASADVNGDGVPDIVAGAPHVFHGIFWTGAVLVFSGLDGTTLRRYDAEFGETAFGRIVRSLGDVDHDGQDDLLLYYPRKKRGGCCVWTHGEARIEPSSTAGTDGRIELGGVSTIEVSICWSAGAASSRPASSVGSPTC